MKFKFTIALTILVFAARASAIKPASEDAKEAIKKQIVAANQMDKDVIGAKRALDKTSFPKDSPEYLKLARSARRARDTQYAAYTKAIHMAIIAYDLEPRSRRGTSVMPWTKGREIVWLPVAGEDPTRELEDSRGNRKETSRTPLDWAGRTFTDGVTYINPETLRKGPDFLASTLLHERTHFEQHTTSGRGDTLSTAESEVEAHQTELDNIDYFFDKSNPNREWAINHIQTLQAQKQSKVDEQRAAKRGLRGLINRIIPPTPNPDFNDSALHTDAELEEFKKQSDKFSAEAREQIKFAHRDHDERLRNTKAAMAARSCANPGSVTQAELNALPEPYDENLVFTPPQGLDACSYSVYMRLGRGVDAEEIRSASEPLIPARPDPPADIPSVVRPIEKPPLAISPPRFPFSSFFPNLKDLAVKACLSPANASLTPNAIPPFSDISFAGDFDDHRAASLSFGMAECPRQLLYKLIEMIRSDKGTEIDNQWLRSMASLYSAPVYVPRPWSGGDPCRDNGNERCPKP